MTDLDRHLAAFDAFRRRCEALILDGRYAPSCEPGAWWMARELYRQWLEERANEGR